MTFSAVVSVFLLAQAVMTPPPPGMSSQAKPPEVATPSDPQERMELAAKVNGLLGMDNPWHVKATYEVFGPDGKSSDTGIYEEWRISDKQYRVAFHSPSLSVEEFGTDQGIFRTGGEWPRRPLDSIKGLIERPVAPPDKLKKGILENYEPTLGGKKRLCTASRYDAKQSRESAPSWCFDTSNAIVLLQTEENNTFQTLFQHISLIHGHYFAKDVQRFILGKPWLAIHIDDLEGLSKGFLSSFAVPPEAKPVQRRVFSLGEVLVGPRIGNKVAPDYPAEAKWHRIEGMVILNGIIDAQGQINALQVLAGPPALQQAALDAVRKWSFTPALVDGKPIEAEMDITVMFRLGG